jgi:hypothetical protein
LRSYIEKKLSEGVDSQSVILDISPKGYDPANAQNVVKEILGSQRKKYFKILGISGGFCLLGVVVTLSTLKSENADICYGAIIFGLIGIIYSLIRLMKLK